MNKVLSNTANQIITRKEDEIARLKAENKRLQYTADLNLTYAQSCVTRYRYGIAQVIVGNYPHLAQYLDGLTEQGQKDLYEFLENYLDIPISEVCKTPGRPSVYACGANDVKLITKCYTDEEAYEYVDIHDSKIQLKGEDQLRALMID